MGGRGSSSNRGSSRFGPGVSVVQEIDESKFRGYARELAEETNELIEDARDFGDEPEETILWYNNGRGEAFACYDEESGTLMGLGSTGGRAGTELLSRIIETETSRGQSVTWMADDPQAIRYYRSMGLQGFGIANNNMTKIVYTITPERAPRALERLRNR